MFSLLFVSWLFLVSSVLAVLLFCSYVVEVVVSRVCVVVLPSDLSRRSKSCCFFGRFGVVGDVFDLCLFWLFVCACLMACSFAVGIVFVVVDVVVMVVVIVLVGGIVGAFSLLVLWLSMVSSLFFDVLLLCC